MPRPTGRRKRLLIWAIVRLFLTVCNRQNDAAAAISLDQPLKPFVTQVAREALNNPVR
jgi:hypothetical protein